MKQFSSSRSASWNPSTQSSLIQRAMLGDELAWENMIRVYGKVIQAQCSPKGIVGQDLQDILQEVYLRVYKSLPTFRKDLPGQSFRRWLRTITRNVIIDHFRQQEKLPRTLQLQSLEKWLADTEEDDEEGLLGRRVSQSILAQHLWSLIRNDFEESTAKAFELMVLDNQSAESVAAELKLSVGAVRQAKYRVLKRLKEEVEGLL